MSEEELLRVVSSRVECRQSSSTFEVAHLLLSSLLFSLSPSFLSL